MVATEVIYPILHPEREAAVVARESACSADTESCSWPLAAARQSAGGATAGVEESSMSWMGSDGANGIASIRAAGGLTIAQLESGRMPAPLVPMA